MFYIATFTILLLRLSPPSSSYELPWSNAANSPRRSAADDPDIRGRFVQEAALSYPVERPIGVRKMSLDEGEMFFPDYWTFETKSRNDINIQQNPTLDKRKPVLRQPHPESSNASILPPLQAPFSLHTDQPILPLLRRLSPLQSRQFSCPENSSPCDNIQRPNSCCGADEVCQLITNTGNGDVGCCSQGQSCSNELDSCQDGYESCPGAQGGGCCVPGSTCMGVGCAVNTTATVTVVPTATASPLPLSSSSLASSIEPIIGSTQTFTVATTQSTTVTAPPIPLVSSSHKTSSPSSSPTLTPSTHPAFIPLRPTSAPPPTTTTAPTTCPTGFYACLALASPGCCRVGRDCTAYSCPPASTSTALTSDGVTVGVAEISTAGLGQGGCALGWFSCATGKGCCPSGYDCGGASGSCTASGVITGAGKTGVAEVPRESGARRRRIAWMVMGVGITVVGVFA